MAEERARVRGAGVQYGRRVGAAGAGHLVAAAVADGDSVRALVPGFQCDVPGERRAGPGSGPGAPAEKQAANRERRCERANGCGDSGDPWSAVAIPAAFVLDVGAGAVLAGYTAIMLAYSAGLKRVAIVDILILCSGVVARAVAGAIAIDVTISPWLYVCSSFAALFFAASKRWAEYRQLGPEAAAHRPSLAQYGGELLNQLLTISAAAALLSYALYTIKSTNVPANGSMALTIPFVAFALFRYLLLLNGSRRSDAPDQIIFTDPQIVLAGGGFILTAMIVMLVHQR